ncbi:unnamed protein product (macronuclear) [Paramecium tetraurelia]|uniref:Uncharacterized protein n=1 Tax=Paramecium tetraurelia TaxID=5888 RepID=A0DQW1_PARTE|nr:uncharacterized protein GSPATT00002828001 [Paramecium tetraurelia]CAK85428.1 unnamed protein product [Paramecium tetraurelia]|eukprot:XP_001452825.1 hypothetical protein (macronuclear) [Paramecium tetraurelia strain d4-2]
MQEDWDLKQGGKICNRSLRSMGRQRILIYEAHMPSLNLKLQMRLSRQYHKWTGEGQVVIVSLLNKEMIDLQVQEDQQPEMCVSIVDAKAIGQMNARKAICEKHATGVTRKAISKRNVLCQELLVMLKDKEEIGKEEDHPLHPNLLLLHQNLGEEVEISKKTDKIEDNPGNHQVKVESQTHHKHLEVQVKIHDKLHQLYNYIYVKNYSAIIIHYQSQLVNCWH